MNKEEQLQLASILGIPDIPDSLYVYGESKPDIYSRWESPLLLYTKFIVQTCIQMTMEEDSSDDNIKRDRIERCALICERFGYDLEELK